MLATPGHAHLRDAARALGIRTDALRRQIHHLEHTVGAALLHTDDQEHLMLTPHGEHLAHTLLPILDLLDRTRNPGRTPS
ncbi:LysR family transcriptional regulator [Frankia casuarinae]|uniref:LysR family transcriptional regulator n=1 Tax=Frankia casuarinae (strain DSM 45818 / CECT 9043 / HFP020203 / CcI3) TaxID=106370 RepID=UPI0036F21810